MKHFVNYQALRDDSPCMCGLRTWGLVRYPICEAHKQSADESIRGCTGCGHDVGCHPPSQSKHEVLQGLRFLRDYYGPTAMDPVLQERVRGAIAFIERGPQDDRAQLEATFERLVQQDTEGALQLITGMFVELTLEYTRRRGFETNCDLIIDGGFGRRKITIHKGGSGGR